MGKFFKIHIELMPQRCNIFVPRHDNYVHERVGEIETLPFFPILILN